MHAKVHHGIAYVMLFIVSSKHVNNFLDTVINFEESTDGVFLEIIFFLVFHSVIDYGLAFLITNDQFCINL